MEKESVKMPRKKEGREYLSVTLLKEDYDTIKRLAAASNGTKSMSDIGREFIIQGLNGNITEKNLDIIVPIIRESLRGILDPAVERLASLSAKTYIESGTASLLTAEAIRRFVPEELQEDVVEVYEMARKQAIRKLSQKGKSSIEELEE